MPSTNSLAKKLSQKNLQLRLSEKEIKRLKQKILNYDLFLEECDERRKIYESQIETRDKKIKELISANLKSIENKAEKHANEFIKKIKTLAKNKTRKNNDAIATNNRTSNDVRVINPSNPTVQKTKSKTRRTTALTDSQKLKKHELMQNVFNFYEHKNPLTQNKDK